MYFLYKYVICMEVCMVCGCSDAVIVWLNYVWCVAVVIL